MRLLTLLALGAGAVPALAGPVVLERIEVGRTRTPTVRLHLSAPVEPLARTLGAAADAPARIYLDFAGTALSPQARATVDAGSGPLVRVRTGQFDPNTARVVLDLTGDLPFEVHSQGRVVTVALSAAPPVAASAAASPPPALPPAPPPAAPPPPPSPPPLRVGDTPLVVIDPGHGGRDPGASGLGGIVEKDLVLDLGRRLAAMLPSRLPVSTMLTRSDDSYVPLDQRLPPPESPAALFVSLHANAAGDSTAHGAEVFFGGGHLRTASSTGASPQAALLGQAIAQAMRARLGLVRGEPRAADYAVLARNPVPSVLVEIAYLTHTDDAARTQDPGYQEQLLDALVEGIAAFLHSTAHAL